MVTMSNGEFKHDARGWAFVGLRWRSRKKKPEGITLLPTRGLAVNDAGAGSLACKADDGWGTRMFADATDDDNDDDDDADEREEEEEDSDETTSLVANDSGAREAGAASINSVSSAESTRDTRLATTAVWSTAATDSPSERINGGGRS